MQTEAKVQLTVRQDCFTHMKYVTFQCRYNALKAQAAAAEIQKSLALKERDAALKRMEEVLVQSSKTSQAHAM